jgi:hypothetical protein
MRAACEYYDNGSVTEKTHLDPVIVLARSAGVELHYRIDYQTKEYVVWCDLDDV